MTRLTVWEWQPAGSPLHILAGALVLVLLAIWAYWPTLRRRPWAGALLLSMRLVSIAVLAVLLLGPSREVARSQAVRRPKLSILIDTSASMQVADVNGQPRIDFARQHWITPERWRALSAEFDVDLQRFDAQLQGLSLAGLEQPAKTLAIGTETRLAESVQSALTRIPSGDEGGSLLVISDGHDSEQASIQPAAALARTKQITVHTVPLGGRTVEPDLALLAVPMQEYLLPNEPGAILVKVYQTGLADASTTLKWKQGDEVKSMPIEFRQRPMVEVQIPIQQAEPGQYEYQLEIAAVPGETEFANNSQRLFCDVQRRRMRVLLLEGQPFWDTKFLAQALRKDERIDLTQITQVSSRKRETLVTRSDRQAPVLPMNADGWSQYDVVIMGRGLERLLTGDSPKQLAEYVEQGGHLVLARGAAWDRTTPEGQRLAADLSVIEPVEWGTGVWRNVTLTLTPAGRTYQWFSTTKMGLDVDKAFTRLPGFEVMPVVEREKPAAIVLARGSTSPNDAGRPALVTMTYGRGSVVGVLGEGVWRWSLLSADKQDLAGFYDTFWSNLVRWLTLGGDFQPGQQVSLQLSRATARLGDPLIIDVLYKLVPPAGAAPKLELIDPQGGRRQVALSPVTGRDPRFRASLEPEAVGVHEVVLSAPGMTPAQQQRKFNVYQVENETFDTSANPLVLRMLSEHTGGECFEPDQADAWMAALKRQFQAQQMPPRREYIWDHWGVMAGLLTWMGLEWLLRRRVGLL